MKNSQKGFIVPVLLVIIAVLVVGGGIYFYQNKKIENSSVSLQTEQFKQAAQPSNQAQNISSNTSNTSKVYTNAKYGFTLQLPLSWSGYTAVGDDNIVFSVKGYENIFSINVFTKAQWDAVLKDDYPAPQLLGENDKYVFGARTTNNGVVQPPSELRAEVSSVLSTFKINIK
jgi:hypothetical protein